MSVELQTKSIEEIFDEMTESYTQGNFIDGVCPWNGDDALMGPEKFAERFQTVCFGFGYREAEIIPTKNEIKEWCQEYLSHLESKFR